MKSALPRFTIVFLFSFGPVLAEMVTPSPTDRVDTSSNLAVSNRWTEIEEVWSRGNKKEAFRRVKKWIKQDSSSPEAWMASGRLHMKNGAYKKSLKALAKALQRSSQLPEAYFLRGQAFEALNNPLDAANEYRAALAVQPGHAEAQEALSRMNEQLGSGSSQVNMSLPNSY